jgi:PP-loop superfamily ATP-utilizing enzyme
METLPELSALEQAEQLIEEFNIEGATLFDHKPVLRMQVHDSEFARVLELRTTLVEKLKPTGFRFIAIDLDHSTES